MFGFESIGSNEALFEEECEANDVIKWGSDSLTLESDWGIQNMQGYDRAG